MQSQALISRPSARPGAAEAPVGTRPMAKAACPAVRTEDHEHSINLPSARETRDRGQAVSRPQTPPQPAKET